ncbi:unnamed protein product [Echinostoma caproni]|uniref:protein disulfide-isomerase n=1 Tax=Echinostoma caproni TaxID=27848 RepID=A0A183ALH1_9TREM|nr:unnamed protein product [Echinostoma caproni]
MWFPLWLFLISPVLGLYDSGDDVVLLTPETFSRVESDDGVWLVEFFAPWCGHCQRLAPEWKKAATALKNVVKVAAVDADKHSSLSSRFSVRGFPTIMVFGPHLTQPAVYSGSRDASAIVNEGLDHLKKAVHKRLGGGSSAINLYIVMYCLALIINFLCLQGSGSSGDSAVIELTDNTFDEKVLNSKEPWLVEFYAPWCGHCKNLKPHWESAARKLKGVMNLAAVDATTQTRLAQLFGIQGFPTIKYFPPNSSANDAVDYTGGRSTDDIVQWAEEKASEAQPPPELYEIVSQEVFQDACENHPLCVIAVVPLLLDCDSKCRNDYLDLIRSESLKFKQQKWGWIWAEGTKQPRMEEALEVGGFGYPALVAMHGRKKQRVTMRGPFNQEGVHDFLLSISLGGMKLQLFPVSEMPVIEPVEPWDGKDAKVTDNYRFLPPPFILVFETQPIEEEELDLDDIKLEL